MASEGDSSPKPKWSNRAQVQKKPVSVFHGYRPSHKTTEPEATSEFSHSLGLPENAQRDFNPWVLEGEGARSLVAYHGQGHVEGGGLEGSYYPIDHVILVLLCVLFLGVD